MQCNPATWACGTRATRVRLRFGSSVQWSYSGGRAAASELKLLPAARPCVNWRGWTLATCDHIILGVFSTGLGLMSLRPFAAGQVLLVERPFLTVRVCRSKECDVERICARVCVNVGVHLYAGGFSESAPPTRVYAHPPHRHT